MTNANSSPRAAAATSPALADSRGDGEAVGASRWQNTLKAEGTPAQPQRFGIYMRSLASARGAEQVAFRLALGLAERGHGVDVLLEETSGLLAQRLAEQGGGIRVVDITRDQPLRLRRLFSQLRAVGRSLLGPRLPEGESVASCLGDLFAVAVRNDRPIAGLRNYVERVRPVAVLSLLNYPNFTALLASRLCRSPTRFVVSVHNHLSTAVERSSSAHMRRVPRLVRQLFRFADAVIAPSAGVLADVARIARLPADRLHVIPNPAFEPDVFALAAAEPAHPWLAPPTVPVILAAGKLKPQKDFPTLLRAFARLRATGLAARLLVLGEGSERQDLRALAGELGIAADVDFPGFVENPYAFYGRASLFVLSSAWEGFGNVLIEAMACGCPVVSTDCPSGPAEILEGGRWGRLVPVGDAEALCAAMLDTLRAPLAREALISRAQAFSRASAVRRYEALLAGV